MTGDSPSRENGKDRTVPTGTWALVHETVLAAGCRAPGIPPETQAVPLEMRVKGFLVNGPASLGDRVTVRTLSGRKATGTLVAVNPAIPHTFGSPVPELLGLGQELRECIRRADGGDNGSAGGGPNGGDSHGGDPK